MRRQGFQSVRHVVNTLQQESSVAISGRAPFICASCRKPASKPASQPQRNRRAFATSVRRSQEAAAAPSPESQRESIAPRTHYDFFPSTFPEGPPPNSAFTPDLRQLRKEFLQLQAKAHPDIVPQDQKRQAEAMSARINEAYKTLQDPLKRAQYLLSLQNIDVEDESAKLSENALLMEVMEAREAVEEVENEEDLVSIRAENNERIQDSVHKLEDCFREGDLERAATEAIRLRYWVNIEESIHGWEKGKGGGLLHH